MDQKHVEGELDLDQILYTEEQILSRLGEMAKQIEIDYDGWTSSSSACSRVRSW